MAFTSDWHIHTGNSCDSACMKVTDLVRFTKEKGIEDYGITDHLNTPFNLPDIEAARAEFLAVDPSPRFHFGIEVSSVSQWEIDEIASGRYDNPVWGLREGGPAGGKLAIGIDQNDIDRLGIEYVIGGVHWPMYAPMEVDAVIRDYHRQYMFLATHPLVTIVAHTWWWMGYWEDENGGYPNEPWLGDFGVIPQSMHDELAAAILENGKVFEINFGASFMNAQYPESFAGQYLEYLAYMKSKGLKLSLASDCHDDTYAADFERAETMLASVGITNDDLWVLPPRK